MANESKKANDTMKILRAQKFSFIIFISMIFFNSINRIISFIPCKASLSCLPYHPCAQVK